MTDDARFAAVLTGLAAHRHLDASALASVSGLAEPALRSVLGGAVPSGSLLCRLAPALGLHTADLFVIAGVDVPDDLTPTDPQAGRWVPRLLVAARTLSRETRTRCGSSCPVCQPKIGYRPIPSMRCTTDIPPAPAPC